MSDPAHPPSNGPDQGEKGLRDLPGVAAFAAMGTSIASCLAVGVILGIYLDRWWHLAPVGLILGIVLGTVAAVASVMSLIRRFL